MTPERREKYNRAYWSFNKWVSLRLNDIADSEWAGVGVVAWTLAAILFGAWTVW